MDDIDTFFNFPKEENDDRNSRILSQIRDWIKCCIFTDGEYNALDKEDRVKQMGKEFYMIERHKIIPVYCRYMDFAKVPG